MGGDSTCVSVQGPNLLSFETRRCFESRLAGAWSFNWGNCQRGHLGRHEFLDTFSMRFGKLAIIWCLLVSSTHIGWPNHQGKFHSLVSVSA